MSAADKVRKATAFQTINEFWSEKLGSTFVKT